ncbi:hypothetical protein [Breoghania sp.]|uniref:hypothetical protein n=1 Tax=Breoghania sp. TaxID=2065378 RepID=UPI00262B0FD9|nr:hypothetical protein [Breoghania sp.]MDJ0933367.1 hypothetical protein [Breoghania sp.]
MEERELPSGAALNGLAPITYAFELSSSGRGALQPDARLEGTPDNQIQARRVALAELISKEISFGYLYMAQDTKWIVLERSIRLAETQSRIEPFLMSVLKDLYDKIPLDPAKLTRAALEDKVVAAFRNAGEYERDTALARRRLGKLKKSELAALGLDGRTAEIMRLSSEAPFSTPVDENTEAGAAADTLKKVDALAARMARISASANALSDLRSRVCTVLSACNDVAAAADDMLPGRVNPIEIEHIYPTLSPDDVRRGRVSGADLPPGAALQPDSKGAYAALGNNGLSYRSTPTGDVTPDNKPIYRSELIIAFPCLKAA